MKAITAKDCSMFLGTRNIYATLYNNFPGSAELNHEQGGKTRILAELIIIFFFSWC